MKKEKIMQSRIFSAWQFLIFFSLVAFVVTVCFLLFFAGMDIPLNVIRQRAGITFLNVLLLSALFATIDNIRRRYMFDRPVKRILEATESVAHGDFNVRIQPLNLQGGLNDFNVIIENFNKMAKELNGIESLRTDFIANVSHELKTPLAIIQNYAIMLQNSEFTEVQRLGYAKSIQDTTFRLSELITNILKLSKLENQQISPEREEFDLSCQLCECLLAFEDIWEDKNITIVNDIIDGITICEDRELLTLVWNNLFSNAMKFTQVGGMVSVSLLERGNFVEVRVKDTGCGITPEVGVHIFEKFYQGDTSHSSQGNGLGLALVKRVIDMTHGEISVESEQNHGSTFTVKLWK